ncbi:MAG TPA: galactokinase family protein [Acidimicrobiales bacterium]|nr:galactokinase family protein [Acidimicrobiales bacterium]
MPPEAERTVRAFCPGRVNLIGDHTDYNQGLALPMAIDLGTVVTFTGEEGYRVVLRSAGEPEPADVDVHVPLDPAQLQAIEPRWARYVAGVVAVVRPFTGGRGTVETNLPVGAGLGSSAALEVALSLALGFEGEPLTMARTCQRAEQAATGVPTGLMDQWVVTGGVDGCALLLDFGAMASAPVAMPEGAEVVVVHSGERRRLDRSGYSARRAECEAAAYHLGPLGQLDVEAVGSIRDPVLRRRARHVVTECDRVRWFARALLEGNLEDAGQHMTASHVSLAQDFEVSTSALDELVGRLVVMPGVYGARLTGAGFGGCAVALTEPGAVDLIALKNPGWRVRPSAGAHLMSRG